MTAIYWDTRALVDRMCLPDEPVVDVRVLYGWDGDMTGLVRKVQPEGMAEFLDIDRRCAAHLQAAREGQVEAEIPSRKLIPDDLFHLYARARQDMVVKLFEMKGDVERWRYEQVTYPVLRMVRSIEHNGIHIDEGFVRSCLKWQDLAVHERSFMQSTLDMLKDDGLVYSKINPVGTRTGRLGVEGGFPCMAVPHGICRQAVTSRFVDGKIVTLDFNAIDYRCLVRELGDDSLKEFYRDSRDFHAKTASYVHAERDVTKKVTYTHLYGGTKKTLQKQTLLPEVEIDRMLSLLDGLFASISAQRAKMAVQARRDGFIFTPDGVPIEVKPDDHDGKVVGLFGQSYSSRVFNKALEQVIGFMRIRTMMSKIIFTVHDEIVFDLHPREPNLPADLQKMVELETGFVVKVKQGMNYEEAS